MARNKILVQHSFDVLARYYDKMTPNIAKNIQKDYIVDVIEPYRQKLSAYLTTHFLQTKPRSYLQGRIRTTTGRLFRSTNNKGLKKVRTKSVKQQGNTDVNILGFFYIPMGKEVLFKSATNSEKRPMPHTYSAWIEYGTASHTITSGDVRKVNIVSRVNYYRKQVTKIQSKLSQIQNTKTKQYKGLEFRLNKARDGFNRNVSKLSVGGLQRGKVVKGVRKRNFINPIRLTIKNNGAKELTNYIMNDVNNYFSNQNSVIRKRLIK